MFVTDYFSGNSWFGKKHTRHYVWQHWCSFGTRGFPISDVQPLFTALVNSTLAVSFEPVTHHGTEVSLFVSEMNELVSLPPSCDGCDHNTKRSLLQKKYYFRSLLFVFCYDLIIFQMYCKILSTTHSSSLNGFKVIYFKTQFYKIGGVMSTSLLSKCTSKK